MKRKYRWIGFTAAQSVELWKRWRTGEGLKSIGRALGKYTPYGRSHPG